MFATDTLLLWSTEGDAVRVNPWAAVALYLMVVVVLYLRSEWR